MDIKSKEFNVKKFYQNKFVILFLAIICTLLWGSAFPFIKIGYKMFNISESDLASKLLFAGIRFALAGIIVLLFFFILNKKLPTFKKESFKGILIIGLIQTTLEYFFIYYGLFYTTGVKSNILNSTSVFVMVILAHFFYDNDKLNKQKILGCLMGFIGVVIINFSNGFEINFNLFGDGFIMLGSASFAIGSVISKKVTENEDSMIVTGYQLFFGGLILLIIGLIGGGKLIFSSFNSILLVGYLIILSSVAFTIWTILFKYNPVGRVSVFNFLTPVFGTLFSAIILHEKLFEVKNIIALILVCIGIYIVNKPQNIIEENENLG